MADEFTTAVAGDDDKRWRLEELAATRQRCSAMPATSFVKAALEDGILTSAEQDIEKGGEPGEQSHWRSPTFFWMRHIRDEGVGDLDEDIALVREHTAPDRVGQVAAFLATKPGANADRSWWGGVFDVWVKAVAIRGLSHTAIEPILTGGRNPDARAKVNQEQVCLEATIVTEDDESRTVWKKYEQEKEPGEFLIRPGRFCPPDAKGPSLYYDARRLYAKVYDKLALNMNPEATQCAEDEPTVLLASFVTLGGRTHGIGWALHELFLPQPWCPKNDSPESWDISLPVWIDHHADGLITKGKLDPSSYCANRQRLLQATRKLGGVLLFEGFELVHARMNYNALPRCAMRHSDLAELERVFGQKPRYSIN